MTPHDRLRQARAAAGFRSAAAAAKALAIRPSTYLAHENGQNAFTTAQAEVYAEAFGVEVTWLMFGETSAGPEITLGAVTLSTSAILAALVQALHDKGALSGEETVEVYESALMLLELQQAHADGSDTYGQIVALARELIEQHLRP